MDQLESAVELIRQNRYDEGLRALSRLAEIPEHRYNALGHRAFHYKVTGRYEEALADYAQMQLIDPSDAVVDCHIADIYRMQGNCEQAIRQAARALDKNPMLTEALRIIKTCHEAQGLAEKTFPIIDPNHPATVAPVNPVIQLLESQPAGFPGSIFPEVARMLYTLVRMVRPTLIIETGTYFGYSALHIAQALEDNGSGHLHSFDLFLDRPGYVSPVVGPMHDSYQLVTSHLHAAGLEHRVTLHRGDSPANIRKVFENRPNTVQMAFIDGEHRISGCMADWVAVNRILTPEGIVVLHDTEPEKCGWLGPRYLMEKLKEQVPEGYGVVNLPTGEGFGIAVLQKYGELGEQSGWWPSLGEIVTERLHLIKHWRTGKGQSAKPR